MTAATIERKPRKRVTAQAAAAAASDWRAKTIKFLEGLHPSTQAADAVSDAQNLGEITYLVQIVDMLIDGIAEEAQRGAERSDVRYSVGRLETMIETLMAHREATDEIRATMLTPLAQTKQFGDALDSDGPVELSARSTPEVSAAPAERGDAVTTPDTVFNVGAAGDVGRDLALHITWECERVSQHAIKMIAGLGRHEDEEVRQAATVLKVLACRWFKTNDLLMSYLDDGDSVSLLEAARQIHGDTSKLDEMLSRQRGVE